MKRYIFLVILALITLLHSENNSTIESPPVESDSNTTSQKNKQLIIDLDKKKNNRRGDSKKDIIKGSIFIGDNDEVHFKGNILLEKAPVTVQYGDNDEVALTGDSFTIGTLELKANEHIIFKDKTGKVFVDHVVRRY